MGRGAGFGAIDRLPTGRYRARYVGPDGRRRSKIFGTVKADARAWLAAQQTDLTAGAGARRKRAAAPSASTPWTTSVAETSGRAPELSTHRYGITTSPRYGDGCRSTR